jgi:hypothetical protein
VTVPNHIAAIVAFLKAETDVKALVDTAAPRVYGGELPREQTSAMPRRAVVVKSAGGGAGVESGSDADVSTYRVDVWNYGASPFDASMLRGATYPALKHLARRVIATVLLHSANRVAGPLPIRDPVTDWPIEIETFEVFVSDVAVA